MSPYGPLNLAEEKDLNSYKKTQKKTRNPEGPKIKKIQDLPPGLKIL